MRDIIEYRITPSQLAFVEAPPLSRTIFCWGGDRLRTTEITSQCILFRSPSTWSLSRLPGSGPNLASSQITLVSSCGFIYCLIDRRETRFSSPAIPESPKMNLFFQDFDVGSANSRFSESTARSWKVTPTIRKRAVSHSPTHVCALDVTEVSKPEFSPPSPLYLTVSLNSSPPTHT